MRGAAEPSAMQVAKSSSEIRTEPLHAPAVVCAVNDAGVIAVEKVTEMLIPASTLEASAGAVEITVGAARQLPTPSQALPPFSVQVVPTDSGACTQPAPTSQLAEKHWPDGVHTTGVPPHAPLLQTSFC